MMSPCCGIVDRKMSEFYFKDPIQSDFSEILQEADSSLLYNWLATEGPEGIMNYIKKNADVENYFSDRYVQNCHLCQSIFSNPDFKPIISRGLKEKSLMIAQKRKWMDVQYEEIFK